MFTGSNPPTDEELDNWLAMPGFESLVEAALQRRHLVRQGKGVCLRCQTRPASGHSGCPVLCRECINTVIDIQENAYGAGRGAYYAQQPRNTNPHKSHGEDDEAVRHAHWDSGWFDAEQDGPEGCQVPG
jgi:hypothetical protein